LIFDVLCALTKRSWAREIVSFVGTQTRAELKAVKEIMVFNYHNISYFTFICQLINSSSCRGLCPHKTPGQEK